jgi:hypothetical protein
MALTVLSKPPARSAERVRLAEMIEQLRDETAQRAALTSALVTADTSVRRCTAAVEDAEADVAQSKADAAQFLVDTAAGHAGDTPRSTRQARDHLQDCQDALDAAREARDELRKRQATADKVDIFRMQMHEAVGGVLRSEFQTRADAMVTEITSTLMRLVEQSEFVRRLADAGMFESARNNLRQIVGPPGVACRLSDLDIMDGSDQARAAGAAKFRSMFDSLLADPDAKLPE